MSEPTRHPVARDGKVIGHYSLEAIRLGLASGQLLPGDHVWAEGQGRWKTLAELAQLMPGSAMPAAGASTSAPSGGFWAGVGAFIGSGLGGIATLLKFMVVIAFGLFIGMVLQSGGKNPNRQGDNDPLRDPGPERRDPDFDN
jgi:hypothetical protein